MNSSLGVIYTEVEGACLRTAHILNMNKFSTLPVRKSPQSIWSFCAEIVALSSRRIL